MVHPDTELRYINDVIGYGVFATRNIPRGTIVWVRDKLDQAFSPEEVRRMGDRYTHIFEKYGYMDRHGDTVLCWDLARFMNHSCEASCLSAGYDFEVAVRDLRPGDELTDDYGTLNLEESFTCACARPHCRGQIRPDDNVRNADRWDELLRGAFPLIQKVAQPLWPMVNDKEDVLLASADVARMRSCRFHEMARGIVGSVSGDESLPLKSDGTTIDRSRREGEFRTAS